MSEDSIQQGSSSQNSSMERIQGRISQDILQDHAKILYLFQCFQEAQDNQLCKDLLQMTFRKGCIDLENQILYPHHIASLGLILSKSNRKWKRLNLASCHLEDEGFSWLHQCLCVKTNRSIVEEINISDNNLTEASLSHLTDIINYLQPNCLQLSDNHVHFAGLKQIFVTMTKISTVKELCVEMNDIKMNGITITALDKELVSHFMSSLSELFIGRNGLYDEGAELLSEGLVNTSSLKILNIWNGNIHTKGAKALACALSKNTSLEQLSLSSNGIGDDGAVAFANVLMNNNKTLTVLDVTQNNIGPTGGRALEDMAVARPSLKLYYSYCSYNSISLVPLDV